MTKIVLKPAVRRRKVAEALIDVETFLRAIAFTEDFSSGYSLSEAISDRLAEIGRAANAKKLFASNADLAARSLETTPGGLPTRQAELLVLKEYGLAAIEEARSVDPVDEVDEEELQREIDEILNDPLILISEG